MPREGEPEQLELGVMDDGVRAGSGPAGRGLAPGGVCLAAGPGAAEEVLIAAVEAHRGELRGKPPRIVPLRIVVPSGSLRVHVASLLTRRLGALAGVAVQTLATLARDVLERAGEPPPAQQAFGLFARRAARAQPELARALEGLTDGYGAALAAIDDLLDAGFEGAHAEALDELLAASGHVAAPRARAVVRAAAALARDLEAGAFGHRSLVFARAARLVERDPAAALPECALWVHGFADATGVQADVVEALQRGCGARVLLEDAGTWAFGERLRARVLAAATGPPRAATPAPASAWRRVVVRDPEAEAREVAARVRQRLDEGAVPERIAVVARDLSAYRLSLRSHFDGLGIPFSALAERGAAGARGRRLEALRALLQLGERLPAERWLGALARLDARALSPVRRAELRHALHERGVVRLSDLAALELPDEPERLSLRAVRGLRRSEADAAGRAARRQLPAAVLAAAAAAARRSVERLRRWPERAACSAHLERLRALLTQDLGWRLSDGGADDELAEALFPPHAPSWQALEIDRGELRLLVDRALEGLGRAPLGGAGGGVQVLSAMEARARRFDHLFVLGLNRGVFPRSISEDPLLPDELRRALRSVLPDLPVKAEGHDEERFLFHQLLASAPSGVLSSAAHDADGRDLAASPLLEGIAAVEEAPCAEAAPRTAQEHARRAAIHGTREQFAAVLPLALAEAVARCGASTGAPAAGRLAVLRELDPRGPRRRSLGPYLGAVGAPVAAADPRRSAPAVTALEAIARCPWQAFLRRVLRLEPPRDAREALPSARDARLLGNLVHDVLDAIVASALPEPDGALEEIAARAPVRVPWPEPGALDALVARCARELAAKEGLGGAGHAALLAVRARPFLENAARLDWSDPGRSRLVLGAESPGRVALAGGEGAAREIRFRADRVDPGSAAPRLTDYKTGVPRQTAQKDPRRRKQRLLDEVARGNLLQAAAYALAVGPGGEGRYLFLGADLDDAVRDQRLGADEARETFARVASLLLDAWERGVFVPRLRAPGADVEPRACLTCEVKEACLRGDSGARRRLGEALEGEGAGADERERVLRALWRLPEATA